MSIVANISQQFSFVNIFLRIVGAFYYFSLVNANRELFENIRVAFFLRENIAGVPHCPALTEFAPHAGNPPAAAMLFGNRETDSRFL